MDWRALVERLQHGRVALAVAAKIGRRQLLIVVTETEPTVAAPVRRPACRSVRRSARLLEAA